MGAASLSDQAAGYGYHAGGTIQTDPRIYLIFWGSGWYSDTSGVYQAEQSLFEHLAHTPWNRLLSQYNDTYGHFIHDDVTLAGVWTDPTGPTTAIDGAQLQKEAANAASANHWTNNGNTQFVILPQSGSSYPNPTTIGYCAYHLAYGGYVMSLVPYLADAPFKSICTNYGPNQVARTTTVSSHEYAESVSDPLVNAWVNHYTNPVTGAKSDVENGDLCANSYTTLSGAPTTIYVQPMWSLASDTCVSSTDSDPKVSRLRGSDRVTSSIAYSVASWAYGGASSVVIVRSTDPGWADGIPGDALAGAAHGPLLLADSSGCSSSDYKAMMSEVFRVLPSSGHTVYIVGGTSGVPACVDSNLSPYFHVARIYGAERCDSSVNVANVIGPFAAVNLVSGNTFADGLSMSSVGASSMGSAGYSATLVTPATSDGSAAPSLCSSADTFLRNFGNTARADGWSPVVRIAGGTAAVSSAVQAEVNYDVCPATLNCTMRLAGSDRYQTSATIASQLEPNTRNFFVTTGQNWPDGVAAGGLAAAVGAPMLLVDGGQYGVESYAASQAAKSSASSPALGVVLGGTATEPLGDVQAFASWLPAPPAGGPIVAGVSSSLCVDDHSGLTTNGNPIQIWTCNGTSAQAWTLEADNTLRVLGGCLTVSGSTTTWGTKVVWSSCNGGTAQQWVAEPYNELVNTAGGLCLDDPGSSTTSGTQLQIWGCNQSAAQTWTLP